MDGNNHSRGVVTASLHRQNGRRRAVAVSGLGLLLALGLLGWPARSHAETVTYTYDTCPNGQGRLCSAVNAVGSTTRSTTTFTYDNMGRISQTTKTIDGIAYATGTSYDPAGRVKSVSYPDNDTVYYGYTGTTLATVAQDAGATVRYATYAGYNELGQPGTVTYGNGVSTTYTYATPANATCPKPNFRLCTITTTGPGGPYQTLSYTYDSGALGVGNLTKITDALATTTASGGLHTNQTQTFVYDDLYRLTKATGPYTATGGSLAITYAYDTIGNLTCNTQLSTCTATTPNYKYLDPAHAHAVTAVTNAAGRTYAYDPNGNMIQRGTDTLTYDGQNRLVADLVAGTTPTSFVYDGDGGRIKKSTGAITTVYIGKLYECVVAGACTKHLFAGSARIASKPITTTGDISYYHTDHLGSTSVVTDKTGVKVVEYVYRPYGETSLVSPISDPGPHYKYTGQEKDSETSLYFYNARYYDPALGRFIQADTIVPGAMDPQAFNRYSYTGNNPINAIDPSGHWPHLGNIWHDIGGALGAIAAIFDPALAASYFAANWAYHNPQRALQYATIAGGVAVGVFCTACAAWVLPAIMAVGSGAQVALAGGSFADIVAGAAVGVVVGEMAGGLGQGAVIAGQTMAIGAGATAGFAGYAGAFAGGAAAGFAQGATTAGIYGGNAIRAGYQGALIGAAMGVAMHAIDENCNCLSKRTSPTIGGPDQSPESKQLPVTLATDNGPIACPECTPSGSSPDFAHPGNYFASFNTNGSLKPGTVLGADIWYSVDGNEWGDYYVNGGGLTGTVNPDGYVDFYFPLKDGGLPQNGAIVQQYKVTPYGSHQSDYICVVPSGC